MSEKHTFFGKLWQKLMNIFDDQVDQVRALVAPIVPQIENMGKELVDKLLDTALTSIKASAANGKSGKDLIDAAYDAIKQTLADEGTTMKATGMSLLATVITAHAQAEADETVTTEANATSTPLQQVAMAEANTGSVSA